MYLKKCSTNSPCIDNINRICVGSCNYTVFEHMPNSTILIDIPSNGFISDEVFNGLTNEERNSYV